MLVIDASVAVDLCLAPNGFAELREQDLFAPPLIYAESLSSLRELHWRGEVDPEMIEQWTRLRALWALRPVGSSPLERMRRDLEATRRMSA
ncbi:MAG: PIN domain-containing protein [Solirubrobacteraceae bacterium]